MSRIDDLVAQKRAGLYVSLAYADKCPDCQCPVGTMHVDHTGRGSAIVQGWQPCADCGAPLGELHVGRCADVRSIIRRSH